MTPMAPVRLGMRLVDIRKGAATVTFDGGTVGRVLRVGTVAWGCWLTPVAGTEIIAGGRTRAEAVDGAIGVWRARQAEGRQG